MEDTLQQPAFTFVGPCYLHGVIEGEATKMPLTTTTKLRQMAGRLFRDSENSKQFARDPVGCHNVYLQWGSDIISLRFGRDINSTLTFPLSKIMTDLRICDTRHRLLLTFCLK